MMTLPQFAEAAGAGRGHGRGAIVSALLHVSAVFLLVQGVAKAPRVVPVHNPGSAEGKHVLLTYTTGAAPNDAQSTVVKQVPPVTRDVPKGKAAQAPASAESKPVGEQGSGASGLSGLGDGNMTIAALKVFPRPQPDLSTLPHGQGGNVILNAVIDAHGSISELTVVQSLSDSIDQQVMATVRNWSFLPATENGLPVASEQEIVLHYERV